MELEYWDCPQRCPKNKINQYDIYRFKKCDTCPRLIKSDDLERKIEQSREKWLTKEQGIQAPPVPETLESLYRVRALVGSPLDQISVTSSVLISTYKDEEDRFRRTEE